MSVVGTLVDNRQPQDQALVDALARAFFSGKSKELTVLASSLSKPVSALRFDAAEYQVLNSRMKQMSYPYNDFYRYVLTIDGLLTHIRSLAAMVQQMDNLNAPTDKNYLDSQILHPAWIAWRDADEGKKPVTYNARALAAAANRNQLVVQLGTGGDGSIDDKRMDEYALYTFDVIHDLVAISQGLYKDPGGRAWSNFYDGQLRVWGNVNADLESIVDPARMGTYRNNVGIDDNRLTTAHSLQGIPARGGAISMFPYNRPVNMNEVYSLIKAAAGFNNAQINRLVNAERLADAFKESGALDSIWGMYKSLQQQYLSKRSLSTLGKSASTTSGLFGMRSSGPTRASHLTCGPGQVAKYFDASGNSIPDKDAVIVRNGQRYLSSRVSIDNSYCDDGVAAAQTRGRYRAMTSRTNFADATGTVPFSGKGAVKFDARALLLNNRDTYGAQLLMPNGEAYGAGTKGKKKSTAGKKKSTAGKKKKSAKKKSTSKGSSTKKPVATKTRFKYYGRSGAPRSVYKLGSRMFFRRRDKKTGKVKRVFVLMRDIEKNNKLRMDKRKASTGSKKKSTTGKKKKSTTGKKKKSTTGKKKKSTTGKKKKSTTGKKKKSTSSR